ncbi:MAG: hypothetical protein JSU72_12320 [Deltaproteobacteria bacterium]|nr:MAG: hypothetical protein JSU72_12320 [Deltaproteobacteria bacterium]
MPYPATRLRFHRQQAFADLIRAANRSLAHGEAVHRWRAEKTSFSDPGDLFFSSTQRCETQPAAEYLELPEPAVRYLSPLKPGGAALLWDKSFLWGYLAVNTLRDLGFSFDLLTAEAVRCGALNGYQLLVVPGGWASLKSQQLGAAGRGELRRFIRRGGGYLGLCGGAGFALQVDEGLGLLPVTRKPISERLPNFSGSIQVRSKNDHPFWWGLDNSAFFRVWWPSQFELVQPDKIRVLGTYGEPGSDFYVSDLNVCEAEAAALDWQGLENDYEINLDPERLLNEPAVLEGVYGQGRVVLSYPHLETPGDDEGNLALFNIWYELLASSTFTQERVANKLGPSTAVPVDGEWMERLGEIAKESEDLVKLGQGHNLWSWRNPWLLQWKRGIRGAEYGTIHVLLHGLVRELQRRGAVLLDPETATSTTVHLEVSQISNLWESFRRKSEALVEAEGLATKSTAHGGNKELSQQVRSLRTEIFDCVDCYGSRSYGGLYRQLLDRIDTLLLGAFLANMH